MRPVGPLATDSTWTLERFAQDVVMLARAMRLDRYAVLGHSFGAFVALQDAVDFPGAAAATILSGVIPSMRFLDRVEDNLESFEPDELRERVSASWARESDVSTAEGFEEIMRDQCPFHFADPLDPRIEDYLERTAETVYQPDVLRHFAAAGYGAIEVEERLDEVTSPVLVLAGLHDRTCVVEAAEVTASGIDRCAARGLRRERPHDVRRRDRALSRGGREVRRRTDVIEGEAELGRWRARVSR